MDADNNSISATHASNQSPNALANQHTRLPDTLLQLPNTLLQLLKSSAPVTTTDTVADADAAQDT
jgi:hypothetical protein